MTILMIADVGFICTSWSYQSLYRWFTNVTLCGTILSFILSMLLHSISSGSNARKPWLSLLACHHFLFEIMAMFNLITTVVYWGYLHPLMMVNEDFLGNQIRCYHAWFVHSAPGLFFLINWTMSDIIMKARHFFLMIPFGIMYAFTNYRITMDTKEPTYPFMDWIEDFDGTVRNLTILVSFLFIVYVVLARISQAIKQDFTSSSSQAKAKKVSWTPF